MRLVLHTQPNALTFTEPSDLSGPFPWLANVGALTVGIFAGDDTGLAVGVSPSCEVEISNMRRLAVGYIGWTLRLYAEIFEDDGTLYFDGLVSASRPGQNLTLQIDA